MALPRAAREIVVAMSARPGRAAVLTDFDGTLAPIVEDPARARPLEGSPDALLALARRYRTVAVVSGRPAAFLLAHLADALGDRAGGGDGSVLLVGMYGMERVGPGGTVRADPRAAEWRPGLAEVGRAASESAPAGVEVEDKGLGLTLHWRTGPGGEPWAVSFAQREADRRGLEVQYGRMSVELRPPLGVDKASAVAELCAGAEAACFLGDDRGDLAAFAALDALGETGAVTFKVGVRSSEAPEELLGSADLVVDGPEGALELLRALASP